MSEELNTRHFIKVSNQGTKNILEMLGYHPKLEILTFMTGNHTIDQRTRKTNMQISQACLKVGVRVSTTEYPKNVHQSILLANIRHLDSDPKIDGIFLQRPLPKHINHQKIKDEVISSKDAGGICDVNLGRLASNVYRADYFYPLNCTAYGIIRLLDYRYIHSEHGDRLSQQGKNSHDILKDPYKGLRVTIISHKHGIGIPLTMMFANRGSEVTLLNNNSFKTLDYRHHLVDYVPSHYTKNANLLISAVDDCGLILPTNLRMNSTVLIDAGHSKSPKGLIAGDVSKAAQQKALAYTPIRNGIKSIAISTLVRQVAELAGNEKGSAYDPIFLSGIKNK